VPLPSDKPRKKDSSRKNASSQRNVSFGGTSTASIRPSEPRKKRRRRAAASQAKPSQAKPTETKQGTCKKKKSLYTFSISLDKDRPIHDISSKYSSLKESVFV
jgi:hypothetical protein